MKKILLLLVFLVTASVLFAQPAYVKKKTSHRNPHPAAKSAPSGDRAAFYSAPSAKAITGSVQQVVDTTPAANRNSNPISTASGPCENAPTVTFDKNTFELDCAVQREYDNFIVNYYKHYKYESNFYSATIEVHWYPDYLKLDVLGKSQRDRNIEAYREAGYTKHPGYQILRLSNGNVIMSYTSNLYDSVVIYRTFNLKNNQGGNILLHIYGSDVVPKDIRGNKDKWEEWRAEMVDKAVAWPIPTPYK